jgi:hypothetical protein
MTKPEHDTDTEIDNHEALTWDDNKDGDAIGFTINVTAWVLLVIAIVGALMMFPTGRNIRLVDYMPCLMWIFSGAIQFIFLKGFAVGEQ